MKKMWAAIALTILLLGCGGAAQDGDSAEVTAPARPITYEPTWESLQQYEAPQWFEDAKFGIFIHWGPYSVPAFDNEWYPHNMYVRPEPTEDEEAETANPPAAAEGGEAPEESGEVKEEPEPDDPYNHHLRTYGPHKDFGYKDFIPLFRGEAFDAGEWADLFQRAGARYVVPVAEHHDGFAMYASSITEWNVKEMGPKRDVAGELRKAVESRGLHFGLSSHYAYNRCYFIRDEEFDTVDPRFRGLYGEMRSPDEPPTPEFMDRWYSRTVDIIDHYKPEVLWFDFGINVPEFQPYLKRLAAYYYNRSAEWGLEPVLEYKDIGQGSFPEGTAVLDVERGRLNDIRPMVWQTDTSISKKSWGYIEQDEFKTVNELVDVLVDIVSKHGCLLLNIGPRPDGVIPDEARQILLGIGEWLEANGEAIYGTRPWKIYGEGPTKIQQGHMSEKQDTGYTAEDIRFTTKGDTLYVSALGWPGRELKVASLAAGSPYESRPVASVQLLGGPELDFRQDASALSIQMPEQQEGDYAFVFKVTF